MRQAHQVEHTSYAAARTFGPGRSVSGLEFGRYFAKEGVDPFDEVEWELRSALIANERGELVFEQRDVEFPRFWSQQATNIVVSKYFRGQIGTPERERSVKQLDRKSTRLNSSHLGISYAVFCLTKKTQ